MWRLFNPTLASKISADLESLEVLIYDEEKELQQRASRVAFLKGRREFLLKLKAQNTNVVPLAQSPRSN